MTGVEMFKKQLDEGMAGDNAGLLLRGIEMCIRDSVCHVPVRVCSHSRGMLTLFSVPLNVRSGSVSVRKAGAVFLGFRTGMGSFSG